ncbi:MAG TPA: pyridoxamine 5'-phosphate oxidase family protein [Candidatus Saccharimonadales bacterium]|nr:pyridoxamine 5'-phosphate oxidase family protein [Candidatus Saccharimonadales bacterium]
MDVEAVVREYIEKTVHMSLATSSENKPWVCEVHFAYDDELNLYFRSLKTRRHSQEIAKNSNVAGNIIDKYDLGAPVVGVYFEGTAKLLGPGTERDQAFKSIKNRLQASNEILAEADREDGHQFYKISVTNWYVFGRFSGDSGQKFSLKWH